MKPVRSTGDRVRLRSASGPEEWSRLLDAFPNATAFHEWHVLQGLAASCGWRFVPLVAMQGEARIGVVPVVLLPRLRVTPALPWPDCGPLVPHEALPSTLLALRRWQARWAVPVVRGWFGPTVPGPNSPLGPFTPLVKGRTYVLDVGVGGTVSYETGLPRERRRRLRVAARSGLEPRASRPGEAKLLLPEIAAAAFARHGEASPARIEPLAAFIDGALARRDPAVLATTLDGPEGPCGMLVALRRGEWACLWLGGSMPEALRSGAPTLLYDALIRRVVAQGAQRIDFVGHVDEGVASFKRSFGAAEEANWGLTSTLVPAAAVRILQAIRARAG